MTLEAQRGKHSVTTCTASEPITLCHTTFMTNMIKQKKNQLVVRRYVRPEPHGGPASLWHIASGHKQFRLTVQITSMWHGVFYFASAAKYLWNPGEGGLNRKKKRKNALSGLFAWKVLFCQTSRWPFGEETKHIGWQWGSSGNQHNTKHAGALCD